MPFLVFFLLPALFHWQRLRAIQNALSRFTANNSTESFKGIFTGDLKLAHFWKEYEDSLHIQQQEQDGQLVTVAVRATVPAEIYFNNQFVVDSRLRVEFFKHLPGLFTGVGIIGTFTGFIEGLQAFQLSENAATVRISLSAVFA